MMRNKRTIQVIALVLAILLVGGTVVGALFAALAEENPPERNSYAISMEYLEDEQALHIGQRLVYVNKSPDRLDRVVFCAAPNMFRRESALMYENDDLEAVFPAGYAPGGIDLRAVRVDGAAAEYGFQGEDETVLRVACDLAPGQSAAFEFDYYLLLTACNAFIGVGDTDARLGAFYFIPGVYDAAAGDFMLKKPLPFTRWLYAEAGDYAVDLKLPEGYNAALSATQNVREFALCFGRRYRRTEKQTASGVKVTVYSRRRDAGRAADMVVRAVEQCEAWFGPFPYPEMHVAESDTPLGPLNYPGLVLIRDIADEMALRFCVAQQYFGMAAYAEPSADAWLSDAVSHYVAYLLLEDADAGVVAAVHCGWRGSVQDILGAALSQMRSLGARPEDVSAAIGPGIGACCFEVGPEVAEGVDALLGGETDGLIRPGAGDRLFVDLKAANARRLQQLGVRPERIAISAACTMCDPEELWSHRVTNGKRGVMPAVIML